MSKSEFYRALEAIIEVPPDTIRGDEALATFEGWDSLAFVTLITFADEKLEGASVSSDRLLRCKTVADLAGLFPDKIVD